MGFTVDEGEVDTFRVLLAAAHDTFEELSALPDYSPAVETAEFPRRNVRRGSVDAKLGAAWSYRMSIQREGDPGHEETSPASHLLAGMNIVVKDNICVAGIPQHNGSDALRPWTPEADATVITRILEAGGRLVGTATCEALSCATVSNTAAAGAIYNPWAHGYSAGGSSSGVAALVGSQHPLEDDGVKLDVHMGIGADQGGSIRVPAAFCGLVGLKATHGLIPYTGVVSCEAVMDHVGPMCRTVWDTALILEAIAGRDFVDDRQVGTQLHGAIPYSSRLKDWHQAASAEYGDKPLTGKRIALIKEAIDAPFMTADMKGEVKGVCQQFSSLGASVEEVSLPWHVTGRSLWMAVCRQSLMSIALGNPAGRRGYYPIGFQETMIPWTQEKWDKLPAGMRNEFINGVYEQNNYPTLYAKCMNLTLKRRILALFRMIMVRLTA